MVLMFVVFYVFFFLQAHNPRSGPSSLAEASSIQLELKYLAFLTRDTELRNKVGEILL